MALVLITGLICYYVINTPIAFVILLFKWYFKVLFLFCDNYAAIYFLVPNFFDVRLLTLTYFWVVWKYHQISTFGEKKDQADNCFLKNFWPCQIEIY